MAKGFEVLFAPYAKKNAAPVVEQAFVDVSDAFVARVLWKNAELASMQRIGMHRMVHSIDTRHAGAAESLTTTDD